MTNLEKLLEEATAGPWRIGGELVSSGDIEIASFWSARPGRRAAPPQAEADANLNLSTLAVNNFGALVEFLERFPGDACECVPATDDDPGWTCDSCQAIALLADIEKEAAGA